MYCGEERELKQNTFREFHYNPHAALPRQSLSIFVGVAHLPSSGSFS
jgi:hypothetical protein